MRAILGYNLDGKLMQLKCDRNKSAFTPPDVQLTSLSRHCFETVPCLGERGCRATLQGGTVSSWAPITESWEEWNFESKRKLYPKGEHDRGWQSAYTQPPRRLNSVHYTRGCRYTTAWKAKTHEEYAEIDLGYSVRKVDHSPANPAPVPGSDAARCYAVANQYTKRTAKIESLLNLTTSPRNDLVSALPPRVSILEIEAQLTEPEPEGCIRLRMVEHFSQLAVFRAVVTRVSLGNGKSLEA
ncbi:hypothetical protein B0H19DRAFT_1081395 [Mycena capillaripes]|nr:hypothetical protein B0H19DRAFT_1081161 [Mycena capillaripes]KAJ6533240.1 hypothetical protein B0H19DRAFT_1081395 [Mycena capillaripes]